MKIYAGLILFFLLLTLSLRADGPDKPSDEINIYKVWFESPKPHQTLRMGSNLTVSVGAHSVSAIKKMYLYLNGRLVGARTSAPFVWDHRSSNHQQLRNLKKGSYKLRVKIINIAGQITYKDCKFYVGPGGTDVSPEPERCIIANPLRDLAWLRTYLQRNSRVRVDQYNRNGKTLFAIKPCHKLHLTYWYDCQGTPICNNYCQATRGARKIKTLYRGCALRIIGR